MNRRLTAFAITAAALLALTGCTGGNDSPEGGNAAESTQSVEDACTQVNDVMTEATAGLQEIDPSDPATAATALRTISDGMGDAADAVTNSEIAGILPDLQTAFASAAESMEAVAAGDTERASELNTALTDVQDSIGRYTELCGAS
ncbi:hypothetical protein [Microbacterium oleivorans]|uniref:Uncharacterized protein n=1 Tax=Microbacterium oleivorans TaxID=273677 RepID=A0A7D5EQI8_9MICO|nr:hypothetical protein [Microbacterium oleivorans]QLD10305.1 hypothetical protein HW566_05790 [Microbacterium oleivorans]